MTVTAALAMDDGVTMSDKRVHGDSWTQVDAYDENTAGDWGRVR